MDFLCCSGRWAYPMRFLFQLLSSLRVVAPVTLTKTQNDLLKQELCKATYDFELTFRM